MKEGHKEVLGWVFGTRKKGKSCVVAQCLLVPYSLTKASAFVHTDARMHPNPHLHHELDILSFIISILVLRE